MKTLVVQGLSKRFGGLQAVNGLNFYVDKGEIFGLIGPNGSGKSTTLSLLMGIVNPDHGSSIKLEGREVCGLETFEIARAGIAMVFQHSRPLMRQTVAENIQVALLPDRLLQLRTPGRVYEEARALGERVGLGSVLDKKPGELPYADLRRLELAKAMASKPKLCLLDEPFAGLAPRETVEFSELIDSLRKDRWTVILVDHNVQAVARLVDRLIVLNAGNKIAEGVANEVVKDAKVREVYFGRTDDLEVRKRNAAQAERVATPMLDVAIKSVSYGRATVLANVNLKVAANEFVSVVGLNGAGKTTLFNTILGFKDYEGILRYEGVDLKDLSTSQRVNLGMSLCPETRELFRNMTIEENLEMGGHTLTRSAQKKQIEWVVSLFPRLGERLYQQAGTLSGGEQQMLTIGRALMSRPRLLLLDEPTLGLAPLVNQHISEALYRLQRETKLTILLAEQNLTFALKHSDRIYLLQTGNIQWSGLPDRFMAEVGQDIL